MARPLHILLALVASSILVSEAAHACSCIGPAYKSKQAAEQHEREWMQEVWKFADTIVLARTVTASPGEARDSERATLLVVRAWKGPYKEGDHIESYTEGIGGGMCDSPVPEFNPFLLYFSGTAIHINGCPSSFVSSAIRSRELDRLKAKDAKAARKRS